MTDTTRGHRDKFIEALCTVNVIANGVLGYSGIARLAVNLKLDTQLFNVRGSKRIRVKRMKKMFKTAAMYQIAEHLEKIQ